MAGTRSGQNTNKTELWTEKYQPKLIRDLCSNMDGARSVFEWLKTFETNKKNVMRSNKAKSEKKDKKNKGKKVKKEEDIEEEIEVEVKKETKDNKPKSCLIVTGSHGTGKTTAVRAILNTLGYNIQTIDFANLKTNKNTTETIKKIMMSTSVMDMIQEKEKKQGVILIDELESLTSNNEKMCVQTLQKLNDIHWFCPIIFIANSKHNKALSNIKKVSVEVKFFNPFDTDMMKILKKISDAEKMKIPFQSQKAIVAHSQQDIRQLINILQDLKDEYGRQEISLKIMEDYCGRSKMKDEDPDLYEATKNLLFNYESVDDCLKNFETEKVLLPLMMHQYYIQNVVMNVGDMDKQYEIVQEVSESLSVADIVENYIYGEQNWDLQKVHGYYSCVIPSFLMNKNADSHYQFRLEFAKDLNKTSIKRINKKNIDNTDICFQDMNINDYIYISKIVRKLILDEKIDECTELLKSYNFKLEHIESLLKIDKIRNCKGVLTTKHKNTFKKNLK